MSADLIGPISQAVGTIASAIIIGVIATRLQRKYQKEKDRQDRDAQWRQFAIDLTRLELERKIEVYKADKGSSKEIRTVIDDFLAFYRDLNELGPTGNGSKTVRELYIDIMVRRKAFQLGNMDKEVRSILDCDDIKTCELHLQELKIRAMEEVLKKYQK
ncbi:hypothetical protein SH580_01405 [Coraliomargarita algicola]|uniref:Uncharacterized protein n=1 Tax=Coraliomargarita algicola TaxID=3092156 RepID=A0ABZ0RLE9_9BACT|nr:hypothetical protein [Coraliomargarita sp. J2-16]WPJ96357.1 hypothetical protein SH580_01405 [Coraliomargarita sp. J2-16]